MDQNVTNQVKNILEQRTAKEVVYIINEFLSMSRELYKSKFPLLRYNNECFTLLFVDIAEDNIEVKTAPVVGLTVSLKEGKTHIYTKNDPFLLSLLLQLAEKIVKQQNILARIKK